VTASLALAIASTMSGKRCVSSLPTELLRLWREKRGEVEPKDLSGNRIVQLGAAPRQSQPGHSATMSYRFVRERPLREIRRRTRVVGAFPDGQSALNLAAARLRHIAGTAWSTKRYLLNIELLKDQQMRGPSLREPVPGVAQPI
jgi:hypothetical protein